jgi:hypothetical protein
MTWKASSQSYTVRTLDGRPLESRRRLQRRYRFKAIRWVGLGLLGLYATVVILIRRVV